MLLAAGMFAACSDNLEDAGAGNSGGTTPATGEGYVKVAINMPTTSGGMSRTEANDQFNNGIADEYAVGQDNWIVFFTGTNESSATVVGWSQLTSLGFSDVNADPSNITTTSEAVVEKVPLNTKYALVILNANGLLKQETTGEDESATSTLKIGNNTTATNLVSFTTALKNQQVSNYVKGGSNYFLMSNAPIAKLGGDDNNLSSGQAVTTLVEVDVYEDEDEAQSSPSNQIYVERAVAKVTIDNTFPKTITVEDNNPLKGSAIALQAWTLDNTNKSVKMVRDVTGWNSWVSIKNTTENKSNNRFFGESSKPYRVYWAIDGNYTTTGTDDLTSITAGTTSTDGWYTTVVDGSNNPTAAYCFENTFATTTDNGVLDDENKATRVLFKVKVTPNITEDGTAVESGETAATDFILFGNTTAVYTKETFVNYLKAYVLKDVETITINSSINEGKEYTTAESLYSTENENVPLFTAGVTSTNAQTVLDALGGNIRFYDDGIMFFHAATIKHFGEEYTALKEGALESNESYLGRYGVVRNNWYELSVNSVGIGSPVIPDDDEKLDEEEAYINCRINVLSWAKRSQNVDL